MKKQVELYLHIPFCVKKCAYCDFLSFSSTEENREQYVRALIEEIKSYKEAAKAYEVPTIFLGGGTPSILEETQTERILQAIKEIFFIKEGAEITTEANPGTVSLEKLKSYRRAGINRISFGLQSTDNEELRKLGRIHTYEEFLQSYEWARKAGFENINIDLISAIPNQTVESWERTLRKTAKLEPEHISAYSLIVEEGTPFYEMDLELPDEIQERRMYDDTETILKTYGYFPYEISNYAKKGMECRHNIGYWTRENYLGLGLGAASLLENRRFSNTRDMKKYLQESRNHESIQENLEVVSVSHAMEEFLFLGLRMRNGVSKKKFFQCFQRTIDEIYGTILEKLKKEELLLEEGDLLFLTKRGREVSNMVMAEFLLD